MSAAKLSKNLSKGETLFPIALFIIVGMFFYDSLNAPPRPMLLPRTVQFIVLALLAVQIVKTILAEPVGKNQTMEERTAARRERLKMLVTFAGMMLIPFLAILIGFLFTGCLYVLLTILYWGGSRIRDIVIAEAIVIALIYGVFEVLLQIPFPAGLLFGGQA
jgi:hypothetical protein